MCKLHEWSYKLLTLARLPYFATFASAGGVVATPPGVSKLCIVELRGKTADCSRRVLAIGSAFFDPRPKNDPVLGDQMSNFREIGNFST